MTDGGVSAFGALVDPTRLKDIVERQTARDSLSADPQGSRRDDLDFAMSEARAAAVIIDQGRAPGTLQHLRRAALPAMFEPRKRDDVGQALPERRRRPRYAADLPQPRHGLSERRRLRGRDQSGRRRQRAQSH